MSLIAARALIVALFFATAGLAQVTAQTSTVSLSGKVSGKDGASIPFASVTIEQSKLGAKCDENGNYTLENIPVGKYSIIVSAIGYQEYIQQITVNSNRILNFTLTVAGNNLTEVIAIGKTELQKIREQPFTVTSVNLAPIKNLNLNMNTILNRAAGVRIRQMGGLGSDFSITLNGMSSLRIFIDGLPADGFGSSMSFNNFPVNIIERIDIYKGVTPVFLGGDVLGGAINIITKKENIKFVDASYSYGSFNTHQASVSGRFIFKQHFAVNITGFFNHSDNNYRMLVKSADSVTYVARDIWIKRPHNAYTSQGLTAEAGIVKKKWADRLMIGGVVSGNRSELQGYSITASPIMQAYQEEITISPTLKYDKTNLFVKGLDLRLSAIYNTVRVDVIDTASRSYRWDGSIKENAPSQGETGEKSLLDLKNQTFISSATINYKLSDNHSFVLNQNLNTYRRASSDPYRRGLPAPEDIVDKQIGGLSYQLNMLGSRWVTNVFVKGFYIKSAIHSLDSANNIIRRKSDYFTPGRGLASTFFIGNFQLKASYEFAATLPEAYQILGNPPLLKPNLELKPEESNNINLGFLYNKQINGHSVWTELGLFSRRPKNYIFLRSLGLSAQYQNIEVVAIRGVEASMRYYFKDRVMVEASATYQDMRHDQKYTRSGDRHSLFRVRIPNTPYFFGNLNAGYFTKVSGKLNSRAGINWSANYVENYFLTWENQGDPSTKNVIPQQISHDASVTYSLHASRYNFSLSCLNVFNITMYDNFMVPRPGRSFNVKIRININH